MSSRAVMTMVSFLPCRPQAAGFLRIAVDLPADPLAGPQRRESFIARGTPAPVGLQYQPDRGGVTARHSRPAAVVHVLMPVEAAHPAEFPPAQRAGALSHQSPGHGARETAGHPGSGVSW